MAEEGSGTEGGRSVGTVLRTSVATLYSHLVTRPTGRAVRLAIERQLAEVRGPVLSVLDFSHVGIVDFSGADEVIARLLLDHAGAARPADAYFLAYGVSEHHRDPIEAVLRRHGLLLVTVTGIGCRELWGAANGRIVRAWHCLDGLGRAEPGRFAEMQGLVPPAARSWLRRLVTRRVALPDGDDGAYSLPAVLDRRFSPAER